ncbi:MAG: hypothetical protein ABI367_06170 [Mucilaginibacter sp.]
MSLIGIGLMVYNNPIGQPSFYIVLFLILVSSYIFVSLLVGFFGIIKVELDKSTEKFTFIRFYSRSEVLVSDIAGYNTSVFNSRTGVTYGIIIKTKDNKLRELNPINLKDLSGISEYLTENSVQYKGETRSFYPFTTAL